VIAARTTEQAKSRDDDHHDGTFCSSLRLK
jgi:hypothetical protein